MLIDCDRCAVRGAGCDDCVISVLLGPPAQPVEFDPAERIALVRLADAGLLPPLRLAPRQPGTRSA
jgi:hypothetical protein